MRTLPRERRERWGGGGGEKGTETALEKKEKQAGTHTHRVGHGEQIENEREVER